MQSHPENWGSWNVANLLIVILQGKTGAAPLSYRVGSLVPEQSVDLWGQGITDFSGRSVVSWNALLQYLAPITDPALRRVAIVVGHRCQLSIPRAGSMIRGLQLGLSDALEAFWETEKAGNPRPSPHRRQRSRVRGS